ncbi:MAG: tRNA (adenosine(37)-N6)-threonylcarbamoyltransferase complex ATPase subunit type 1 TsaE [Acidobacteria bacterium]|nr:tRNA (adenosine(37)-N6)-threonylcarbamoyltransferase complex ATPase subunit type 1 TsaE [Acidobacteriota bacterium]
MSARVFRTRSEEETIALGEEIARGLKTPAVVLLIGELGAGKTTIAKGLVRGLGAAAPEDVCSPTYTLIHEYGERPKVYHIDLYRLERASEVLALGIDDLLDGDAILLVEWGERFSALWPPDRIEIHVSPLDEQEREVTVTGP